MQSHESEYKHYKQVMYCLEDDKAVIHFQGNRYTVKPRDVENRIERLLMPDMRLYKRNGEVIGDE